MADKKKVIGKPFKKGEPKRPNSGRKKGTPNKVTKTIKEAIAYALSQTQDDLPAWLRKAGKRSGTSGVLAWTALAEFVQPKLNRTEHTGENGNAITLQVVTADEATKMKLMTLGGDGSAQKELPDHTTPDDDDN